jgi:hypothetical protein
MSEQTSDAIKKTTLEELGAQVVVAEEEQRRLWKERNDARAQFEIAELKWGNSCKRLNELRDAIDKFNAGSEAEQNPPA